MQERDRGQKPPIDDPARRERVTEPSGGPIGKPPHETSAPRPPGSIPPTTEPWQTGTERIGEPERFGASERPGSFHERFERTERTESPPIGGRFPSAERVLGQQQKTGLDARQSLEQFADAGKGRVAHELDCVARALRKAGQQMEDDEESLPVSRYAGVLGEKVEEAARFLERTSMNELVDEVQAVARRRPIVFLGSAFAAGFLVARLLKTTAAAAAETDPLGEEPALRPRPQYST
jgi:hypothetical protein